MRRILSKTIILFSSDLEIVEESILYNVSRIIYTLKEMLDYYANYI